MSTKFSFSASHDAVGFLTSNCLSAPVRLAFVLFSAVVLTACGGSEQTADEATSAPRLVRAIHPLPVSEADRWHLVADVVPEKLSALSFLIAGRVQERRVDPGDTVAKDDVLMVLDDTDVRLKLKALEAQLKAAESDLVLARKEWQRIQKLFARKLVSQDVVDNARNRLNNVVSRVEALRWQLKELQRQLDYTRLKAPADGVIISVLAEKGSVVAPGHPVLQMQLGSAVEFAVGIPAARLQQLPKTATAEVNGKQIPVRQRYLSPQADPVTRTWPARYQVSDPGALATRLVPGDFAKIWFSQPVAEPLLKLPVSAVFAENSQHYVWRIDARENPPRVRRVAVIIVKNFPAYVWVRAPLTIKDQVVAMGVHLLSENEPVRIIQP